MYRKRKYTPIPESLPLIKVDGSIYIGQLLNGEKHGYGKLINIDGSWYFGTWKYNKKHGLGYIKDKDNKISALLWIHDQSIVA